MITRYRVFRNGLLTRPFQLSIRLFTTSFLTHQINRMPISTTRNTTILDHQTTKDDKKYSDSLLNQESSFDSLHEAFDFDSIVITRRNNSKFASSDKPSIMGSPTKNEDKQQNQLFPITIPSFVSLHIEAEQKPVDLLRFLIDSNSGFPNEETIRRKPNSSNLNFVTGSSLYEKHHCGETISLPVAPITATSINSWIHELPHLKELELQFELLETVFDDLLKKDETFCLLDKESIRFIVKFYGRINNFDKLTDLRALIGQNKPDLNFYSDFGVEFLRYSILGSSSASFSFIEFLKSMKESNLKLDPNLLYTVFYQLDRFQRLEFLKLLKSRGIELNGKHREFNFVLSTETSDQLMSLMNRDGREWSPGLIQFACELMLDEGKLIEAWFFIKTKYFRYLDPDLISTRSGMLFINYLKENKMAHHIPSFLICFNSISEQNFDDYGYMKIIEDRIELGTSVSQWRMLTRAIIDFPKDEKLRQKLLRKVNTFLDSINEEPFKEELTLDESELLESLTNPPTNEISIFYKARWNPLFTRFLTVESLRDLFYPDDNKFNVYLQNIDFTLYKHFDGDPISGWSEFCKLTNNENLEMNHDNTRRFFYYFIGSNEFHFAFAFLNYLDRIHGINVQADGYCYMLYVLYKEYQVSKNWLFLVKLLHYLTSYNTAFWDPDGVRKRLFESLAYDNGFHDFKIDDVSPLERENIDCVLKHLQWEYSLNFVLHENSKKFRKAASLIRLGYSRREIRLLIKSNQLQKAWTQTYKTFIGMPRSIAEIYIYYFENNNQLYNLYLFAEWIKFSSSLHYADELYPYIIRKLVRGLIGGEDTALTQNQVAILKLLYVTSRNIIKRSDFFSRAFMDKLTNAGMTDWKFSKNELNMVIDIKHNLIWKFDNKTTAPVFDCNEYPEEYQIIAGWFTKKTLPVTLVDLEEDLET